jgi:hypothetical protein
VFWGREKHIGKVFNLSIQSDEPADLVLSPETERSYVLSVSGLLPRSKNPESVGVVTTLTATQYKTRSIAVATYLVAAGSPFPSLTEGEWGRFGFTFDDPTGDWRGAADELDLRDTESDRCSRGNRRKRSIEDLKIPPISPNTQSEEKNLREIAVQSLGRCFNPFERTGLRLKGHLCRVARYCSSSFIFPPVEY